MTSHRVAGLFAVSVFLLCPGFTAAQASVKDACALIKPTEVQSVDANAKIANGVAQPNPFGAGCRYSWGPGSREWGNWELTVTVMDAAKAFAGLDPGTITQGILIKVQTGAPNAVQIPGVGDAAVFSLNQRYPQIRESTAEAYLKAKGVYLTVSLHGGDALATKNQLIALLKTAVSRL
jgi:hypothetical protein